MKFITIDLDGTLLSEDQTISEKNLVALKKAQAQGHTVAISSGRSFQDTEKILEIAGLQCPFVTGNGAITAINGETIRAYQLPFSLLQEMMTLLNDIPIYYELYAEDGIYFFPNGKGLLLEEIAANPHLDKEIAHHSIDIQFRQHGWRYITGEDLEHLSYRGIYKIFIYSFAPEKLQRVKDCLAGREDMSITTSGANKLEIAHKEASKGNALIHLANYLGIPLENTVAIGDSYNDVSMFKAARVSIAMGNANVDVQKLCTYVTRTNEEDGVAWALNDYVLSI